MDPTTPISHRRWLYRLRGLIDRRRVEDEVTRELRTHLELEIEARIAAGMSPSAARRTAVIDFGGVEQHRVVAREERWGHRLGSLQQDLLYATRSLRRAPGFTLAAVLTLALGIGSNAAIWSLGDAVLRPPLPYPDADRLLIIHTFWRDQPAGAVSPAEYLDYRDRLGHVLSSTGAYAFGLVNLAAVDPPAQVAAAYLTPGTLDSLRVEPILGRAFTVEEAQSDAAVGLISHATWRARFASDPGIVGRTVLLEAREVEILGVLPPGVRLPEEMLRSAPTELFLPFAIDEAAISERGSHFLSAVARVRSDVAPQRAQSEIEALGRAFVAEYPEDYPPEMELRVTAVPVAEHIRGPMSMPLTLLLAAVGVVLLAAAANVASLLLARAERRRRELALRASLGATRGRLVQQLLVESALLAGLGGVVGLGVAYLTLLGLSRHLPVTYGARVDPQLDPRMLLFTLCATLGMSLLCGVMPALRAGRAALADTLRAAGRATLGSTDPRRLRRLLTAAQLALALVLLSAAGQLGRSLVALLAVDPGFRTAEVTATQLNLPAAAYPTNEEVVSFYAQVVERLDARPEIEVAGAAGRLVLDGRLGDMGFTIDDRPLPAGSDRPDADWQVVTPGYFSVLDVRLLRGRVLDRRDHEDAPGAVVINQTFAHLHFADREALGRRLILGGEGTGPAEAEVVGIVADVRHGGLGAADRPQMYLSHAQFRFWGSRRAMPSMFLLARSSAPTDTLRTAFGAAIHGLDADLPFAELRSLDKVRHASLDLPRLITWVLGALSAAVLALAAVGLYAVVAESVSQRLPELALRRALGADGGELRRQVLGEGLRLLAVGLLVGIVGDRLASRWLGNLLYGVQAFDTTTLAAVAGLLSFTVLLACWLPARRATRVDPATLLRAD